MDRGEGDVDSILHAAESANGSEEVTGLSQQPIPATTTCASCTRDVGAYFNPSTSLWTEHPSRLPSEAPLTGKNLTAFLLYLVNESLSKVLVN